MKGIIYPTSDIAVPTLLTPGEGWAKGFAGETLRSRKKLKFLFFGQPRNNKY